MPVLIVPPLPETAEETTPEDAHALAGDENADTFTPSERVFLCGSCSSTLDVARQLCQRGELAVWDSVLAVRQWAGRGQLRRKWVSGPGNLFAAWRLPRAPVAWRNMVSVLVGWLLCDALGHGDARLQLKWPNDLLLSDRKVGGILLEECDDALVAGIGLNLASCPEPELLRVDRACPAAALGGSRSILRLWLELAARGRQEYDCAIKLKPEEFARSIAPSLAWLGRMVRLEDGGKFCCGRYEGIDADGGLILQTDAGKRVFFSGSLALEG